MTTHEQVDNTSEHAWQSFITDEELTNQQADHFKHYLNELLAWNKKMNLTSIDTVKGVLDYHFQDSLELRHTVDLKNSQAICDVGTGAGFPALPLKICYPELSVVLMEVNTKKIAFLEHIIDLLDLENIEITDMDWRTFLRQAPYPNIDYFLARASLRPDELVRAFKPGCAYKDAKVVYWASKEWHATEAEKEYIQQEVPYKVGNKFRKLVFLQG